MLDGLEGARNLIVRRWGELGGYWGINRTMAEIHALLFVAGEPLCTDDVMDRLKISRGNASMNLRALVDWGLIRRAHKFGDRKEYFEADTDVWSMFETIMRERRRREVEPILATIDRCVQMVSTPENHSGATLPAGAARGESSAAETAPRNRNARESAHTSHRSARDRSVRDSDARDGDGHARDAAARDGHACNEHARDDHARDGALRDGRVREDPAQAGESHAPEDAAHRHEFRERLEDLRHFLTTMGKLFELMLVFGRDGLDELARSMGDTRAIGGTGAMGSIGGMSDPRAISGVGAMGNPRAVGDPRTMGDTRAISGVGAMGNSRAAGDPRAMGDTRAARDARATSDARKKGGAGRARAEQAAQPARPAPPPRTRKARARTG